MGPSNQMADLPGSTSGASAWAAEEHQWVDLAQEIWLNRKQPSKVTTSLIEDRLWRPLESSGFDFRSLALLESLQLLEYLWEGYNETSTNHHVLLIALMVTVKRQQDLPAWSTFDNADPSHFSSLFRRILSLCLDTGLPTHAQIATLTFLITAFQSLDNGLVRKECAPLVSISVWHNIAHTSKREAVFEQHTQLKKSWRAAAKRYEAGDEAQKARLRFERTWLYTLILKFLTRLQNPSADNVAYCERFMELLADLESQLPTRRYVNTLLKDLHILAVIRLSPMFRAPDNGLFRDLFALLRHYIHFSIDDTTGIQYSRDEAYERHCQDLAKLQRVAIKHFKAKLTILALANYSAIDQRLDLEGHIEQLDDSELHELCTLLGIRSSYPDNVPVPVSRNLLIEAVVTAYEGSKPYQDGLRSMSILPTETSVYDPSLMRNETYDGSQTLAIPKLNLQYLSVGDFLWRSFILYRCEQFFEIRKYLEGVVKRLQPVRPESGGAVGFGGFSRMALPVTKPAILEAAPPKVGHSVPAYVRAEVTLNVSRLTDGIRKEWEHLRPEDTVYLLALRPANATKQLLNGNSSRASMHESGIISLRTAEIVQVLDENGRQLRDQSLQQSNGNFPRPRLRRLLVNLDPSAFAADVKSKEGGEQDVYETLNVLVRRNQRENNFKKILETIQSLALLDIPLPAWLHDTFLGFGDPSSVAIERLVNQSKPIDYRDTFISWDHLVDSFPESFLKVTGASNESPPPPYILESALEVDPNSSRPSRKRRREDAEPVPQSKQVVKVTTYEPPNTGPYPSDAPKANQIRFTPIQVEAIASGMQPGLTLIVGPPGTGKTDVATQIISNIYHNHPSQRTLLVAHSNQALNQLFQKIVNLDIDGRHLLRLGQGEGDLETEEDFGKYGRVESFMDNRAYYLSEVDRLAANFGAPGAHGNSCETAEYFNMVHIIPAWKKFWDIASAPSVDGATLVSAFPFHDYFRNAPQPLFPPDLVKEDVAAVARGCQFHISKIFNELEDIRPFEIIRNNKDKTNYLMIKEARIIAMTSTYAAMRQHEIASLGFHYDNVVMEEAAQITEIENFIPLALQNSKNGSSPLQRVVLLGDHLQNAPVIQNMAFRHFADLEQSLFLRLVRLNVPTISLDHQGRARPSIAELYKWRYPLLENLPNVLTETAYLRANAGFRYEYQFIDVEAYKGSGETQPSSHYYQNLGEAEYAVALFQYMRLLGYPASKISILTTYAGQRALIRDVLGHRCAGNKLFGMPRIVVTVDKYQGEQNDYIILSLVRTTRPGYLRDIRRLTVALSRARLGLYILGRRSVFEATPELARAFELPLKRPPNLMLTINELYPSNRSLEEEVEATEMTGVEHLGQYVYEMTQAKVQMLKSGTIHLPPQEPTRLLDMEGDDDLGGEAEDGPDNDALVEPEDPSGIS